MAAVPRTWLAVTTPVPPMPGDRTRTSPDSDTRGSGGSPCNSSARLSVGAGAALPGPFDRPPWRFVLTLMNDGQSPSMHEKSRLQVVWLIRRLVPYSVPTGSTDKQFETVLQSPQPSQIRSLIKILCDGLAVRPRFRSRRFSAAQR